jgi:undecaprenyl-diphosphatase
MDIIQAVVLGILQGVFEWLPVSSEAVLSLVMNKVFGTGVEESVNTAIWLHTGTMLAALFYLRDDFISMVLDIPGFLERGKQGELFQTFGDTRISFMIIATVITAVLGGFLYVAGIETVADYPRIFTAVMGTALLVTGLLRFYQSSATRKFRQVNAKDSVLVGLLQSLSIIPGISRSASTVFVLFYRGFDGEDAFRMSFLLSVPAVFIANIGVNLFSGFTYTVELVVASLVAMVVGYLTIDAVIRIADRTGVAYLCFILSGLTFASLLL